MDPKKPLEPRPDNSFAGNDPRAINYDDRAERAYWVKLLGVSDQELLDAIQHVGLSAQRVKEYLAAPRDKT